MVILQQYFITIRKLLLNKNFTKKARHTIRFLFQNVISWK